MEMIETEETNQFTFEAFAAHPFYTEVNRALVRQALAHFATRPVDVPLTIVDMACGTGCITRLIAEEMGMQGRQSHLICNCPSAEAFRPAHQSITEIGYKYHFIPGDPDDLPKIINKVDDA